MLEIINKEMKMEIMKKDLKIDGRKKREDTEEDKNDDEKK
jgi:hypothetical protein